MPAKFELEAVRARHGDALLLHTGRDLVLIDGGAARVYDDFLGPRLRELRGPGPKPLPIRLLVVSHIDDDHVNGLLDLTAELIDTQGVAPPLVDIHKLWHNSFSDAVAGAAEGEKVATSALRAASVAQEDPQIRARMRSPTRLVLQSVGQGRQLRQAAERLKIPLNKGFDDGLVLRETARREKTRVGRCTLRVVGPGRAEVDRLKKRWRKDLEKILKKEQDKKAALEAASKLDRSVFNLASIVLVAESEGRTMLLTGDARGDMILEWLEAAGLLEPGGGVHFDLVKLPHHGSDRNVDAEFFERITADHYVVSGDGRHGNPEPATFDLLFQARGGVGDYKVHMTYGPDELRQRHEFDDTAFQEVLGRHPGARDRLAFPAAAQRSITVGL